jgi:hypothetical protein
MQIHKYMKVTKAAEICKNLLDDISTERRDGQMKRRWKISGAGTTIA